MDQREQTEELKRTQLEREAAERQRARKSLDETEAAAHERRAEKAEYLRRKLDEREQSERDAEEPDCGVEESKQEADE